MTEQGFDAIEARIRAAQRLKDTIDAAGMGNPLKVEHEIQRQMIERLGIEWTPGEPFYALVEDEINRLRDASAALAIEREGWRRHANNLRDRNIKLWRELYQASEGQPDDQPEEHGGAGGQHADQAQ